MGQACSVESRPPELQEVISFRPTGPLPSTSFRSNLKIWRFFATTNPLDIRSAAVTPHKFKGFDAGECYVLLHIYRRKEPAHERRDSASEPPPRTSPSVSPPFAAGQGTSSTTDLVSSTQQVFTPRGLAGPFSGYDDCGPYPFERRSDSHDAEPPLAHDIYIWNGKSALALTKAVALTKCFELERYLINDDVGAIHHLHRGCCGPGGGEQLPADSLYRADYRPPKLPEAREENHLLALLCGHADGQPVECSSLLACMLPSLTSLSGGAVPHAQFPELHKALFSAAAPTGATPPPSEPVRAPAPSVGLDMVDFEDMEQRGPGGGLPPPPLPPPAQAGATSSGAEDSTELPRTKLGLGGQPPPPPPPPASLGTSSAELPPASALPPMGVPKLSKLSGLGSSDVAPVDAAAAADDDGPAEGDSCRRSRPASAGSRPVSAGGREQSALPKMPKLGLGAPSPQALPPVPEAGGGGGCLGLNLDLVNEMKQEGAMPMHGRDNRAEKLRHFSTICSEVTPQVFLGGDAVARNLEQLQSHGVTHVLNAAGVACPNYHEDRLTYLTLHLYDSPNEDISTVLYDAVAFIEDVVQGGGCVYIHCHQGVSRSSAVAIAYLMWARGWGYEHAYSFVRERRGIASPNAGFIARLMRLAKRFAEPTPTEARLYRMVPAHTAPRACLVEGELGVEMLDPRTCLVLHAPACVFVWCGKRAHAAYTAAAHTWAARLVRFEKAAVATTVAQGDEPAAFWAALGGGSAGEVPPKVAAWDADYGVGKEPVLKAPKLELPGGGDKVGAPAAAKPHAASTDPSPLTPRGRSVPFAPLETPRGRQPEPEPEPEPAAKPEPQAALFELEEGGEWEEMGMFDSDDFDEAKILVLLARGDGIISSHGSCFVWVGSEADEAAAHELGAAFVRAKELPAEMPIEIVISGKEPGLFWSYFVNG